MAKERLTLYDKYGNEVDYDVSTEDVTLDNEGGKSLKQKLQEVDDATGAAVKKAIFNGVAHNVANGAIDIGSQMQADWDESSQQYPAYIKNKPNVVTGIKVGESGSVRTPTNGVVTIPEGGSTIVPDNEMSATSDNVVKNRVIKAYVEGLINNLINGAPAALDTLKELADALGDNDDAIAGLTNLINSKANDNSVIKSISVNGTAQSKDTNGNVNINVQSGAQGNDGITPHIDALTGNWFIGETDTHVKAQGEQGNSGVSSADGVAVVNNLDGEPADLESGQVAVLSANMGKLIGERCIPLSGTFADAYDKAKVLNAVFPWMLIDEDEDGNPVKKMMWHVGNKEFVDAIGGKVNGVKNGVTIVTDTPGHMRIWDTVQYYLQTSKIYDYELHVGENNFSFDDIGGNRHVYVEFIKSDKSGLMTNATMSIDFGGMTITTAYSGGSYQSSGEFSRLPNLFSNMTNVKSIKRLNINPTGGTIDLVGWFSENTKLETLQIGGTVTTGTMRNWLQQSESLIKLDLSGLSAPISSFRTGFNFTLSNKLEYIDIRGFDFSGATSIASFLSFTATNVVKTVVVGNIDTSSVTSSSGFCGNITNATLVCTQDTPPAWGVDIISGHFTSIKVPNKTVDVEGTPTAVIDLYKAATGWSTYEGIMSTYEEGEY